MSGQKLHRLFIRYHSKLSQTVPKRSQYYWLLPGCTEFCKCPSYSFIRKCFRNCIGNFKIYKPTFFEMHYFFCKNILEEGSTCADKNYLSLLIPYHSKLSFIAKPTCCNDNTWMYYSNSQGQNMKKI